MNSFLKVVFFSLVLLFSVAGVVSAQTSPSPSPVATDVNSFDMFWPVVAGKVEGESLYKLKLAKESLREALIFSEYRKADYNITLSVKRAVEAEKLYLQDKKYDQGKTTLKAAQEKRQKVLTLIGKVEAKGQKSVDLKNTLKSSLEKQTTLMTYIASQVPDNEKTAVNDDIKAMQELLSKLQ